MKHIVIWLILTYTIILFHALNDTWRFITMMHLQGNILQTLHSPFGRKDLYALLIVYNNFTAFQHYG